MTAKLNLEHSGPPLALEEIEAFEREIGARLPDDYKQFLLAENGGATEADFAFLWEGEMQTVGEFGRLLPERDRSGLRLWFAELRELNCDGYLPVVHTLNGQFICLALGGGSSGAVAFTVYEYKTVFRGDLVPIAVAMAPLAGSFTQFLDLLVEIPKPQCRIRELGERGTPDNLAQFLAEGNSIDAVGEYGSTIVCEAIKFNNRPMVQACIERGASLSGTIETAVRCTRTELIELLVDAGADVNEADKFGHTPLHHVIGTGLPGEEGARKRELRDLLITSGAIDPADSAR